MHALACNSDNILIFSIAFISLTYYTTHREHARDRERESEYRTKRTCARRQLIETETTTPATTIALSLESEQSFVSRCVAARSRTSSNMFAVQPGSLVTSSHCRPSFIICCRCFSAVAVVVGNFMLLVLLVAVVRRHCCCC